MEITRLIAQFIREHLQELDAYDVTEVRENDIDGTFYVYLVRDGKRRLEITVKDCG